MALVKYAKYVAFLQKFHDMELHIPMTSSVLL